MSEQRFTFNVNKYQIEKDEEYFAYLNVVDAHKIVKKLNEQQFTINNQEQKIKILQQEINDTQAILEMLTEKLKGWNNE